MKNLLILLLLLIVASISCYITYIATDLKIEKKHLNKFKLQLAEEKKSFQNDLKIYRQNFDNKIKIIFESNNIISIQEHFEKLEEKDIEIKNLYLLINELQKQINLIDIKDDKIENLKIEIENLKVELNKYEEENNELIDKIESLKNQGCFSKWGEKITSRLYDKFKSF